MIVFIAPEQVAGQPERDFIKRIIGMPGETVEIKECTVFINGEPLDEPYILSQTNSTSDAKVVPPDRYFVLGDNRDNSRDSRAHGHRHDPEREHHRQGMADILAVRCLRHRGQYIR